ncbi:MAG: TlpA family protein disulfide reductase [Sphingobacteriaceae bacterium]
MKYLFIFLFFLFGSTETFAQRNPVQQGIPPFRILSVADSTYFTPVNLKKNKPVVVIYFAPDCDHCFKFTKAILGKIKTFRDAQLIFITFAGYKNTKDFVKKFGLAKYPNIIVGTEGYTYTVQRFYKVSTTPFTAVYDKSHLLLKLFPLVPNVSEITSLLRF